MSWLLILAILISDDNLPLALHAHARCAVPANVSSSTTRVTEFSYDVEGRLAQVNSPEGVINYGYDLATGRHTSTCTTNSELAYGYDELGRLKTVSVLKRNRVALSPPEVTTYTYTKVGSREAITLPDGMVSFPWLDGKGAIRTTANPRPGRNQSAPIYGLTPFYGLEQACAHWV